MVATSLTDTQGIVAIAAAAAAVVALLGCLALALSLRRLRAAQRVVLGEAERDVVAHAVDLQDAFAALREYVADAAQGLEERLGAVELALQGAIAHRSLVRYDAYNELSGQQSMSIALLDGTRSGIVLSCIHHRDQARVYAKQVRHGQSELELSPRRPRQCSWRSPRPFRATLASPRSEMPPRAGYLGPAGTFSEEALLASAVEGAVEPVALGSIYETVTAVREGTVEWALAPIENSLDGSVTITLDLLAGDLLPALEIVGETLLGVRHSLIAREAVELSEIDTVLSHPQVPGQCTRFLRAELAHAQVLPASSTAEAVRLVAAGSERGVAALGTRLAAEIYGAVVLRADVQDRDDNATRFVWLARAGEHTEGPPCAGPPRARSPESRRKRPLQARVEDIARLLGRRGG